MRCSTSLAVLALAIVLAACSENVTDLGVGDCFDDVDGIDGSGEITDVPVVDCTEPHDNEVFHTYDLPGDDYPGQDAILADAQGSCVGAFENYVGTDYASSRLDIFPIYPTPDGWADGDDRTVVCSLYDLELAQLTGSMRGAGE
jgi:hypothetical protein